MGDSVGVRRPRNQGGVEEETKWVIVQALCARTSPLWDAATRRCRPYHHRRSVMSVRRENIIPQFLGPVTIPVVQALPAFIIDKRHHLPPPPPPLITAVTSANPKIKKRDIKSTGIATSFTLTTAIDQHPPTPASSSRSTRSRAAPYWSPHESLILLNEIASLDDHWVKSLSWYQRWNMIAENCAHFGVIRSSTHCKQKWESLLVDYKMILKWESNNLGPSFANSYWGLRHDQRIQLGLPPSYDRQVFDAMAVFGIAPPEDDAAQPSLPSTSISKGICNAAQATPHHTDDNNGSEVKACKEAEKNVEKGKGLELQLLPGDSDADNLNDETDSEMFDISTDSGSDEEADSRDERSPSREVEIASKLEENAQKIHAILEAEVDENAGKQPALMDLEKINNADIELASRQANDLIKILGHFADSIDEFAELIKETKPERIRPMRCLDM